MNAISISIPIPMPMSRLSASVHLAVFLATLAAGVECRGFEGYERSLQLVRKELTRRPRLAALREILAGVHFRAGHFREAIDEFESAIRDHPRAASLYMGLAAAYAQREDDEKAAETYGRVLTLGIPGLQAQVRVPLAAVRYRLGDYDEAVELLGKALKESGATAELHFLLGRALNAKCRALARTARTSGGAPAGDSAKPGGAAEARRLAGEAARCFREAIALDPSHARAHYGLGRLLLQQGEKELGREAMETFRRLDRGATPLGEQNLRGTDAAFEAETAIALARVLFRLNRDAALAHVDHALKLQPTFDRALALRARFYLDMGRRSDAARAYEDLLARYPEHAEGLWNLGMMHLRAGEVRLAAPRLLRATELRKNVPEGWEILYGLATRNGIYADRAEYFARQALRCRPDARNYGSLGIALFEAGKLEESRRVLLQGLEAFPDDPGLRTGLNALLEAEKRRER